MYYPLHSLREGHWFKLICGASFQHLPAVRNLTLAYTLAGADCIDVAADPVVIAAAKDALQAAGKFAQVAQARGFGFRGLPWLMVSLNDGEDPHFRKAEFDPEACPTDCPRPCESVCPAQAIAFADSGIAGSGVIDRRCYGCGRCIPVCPQQLIFARSYVYTPEAIAPLIWQSGVDALEIHTKVGHEADFKRLWSSIKPWVGKLKLIAISCPDGENLLDYLWTLHELMMPLPCALIWQTDGRPMSGDIGSGTTRAAVKLGQKVLAANLPGYVQLAGGTNDCTVAKLQSAGLIKDREQGRGGAGVQQSIDTPQDSFFPYQSPVPNPFIAGVAYGSYARVLLAPVLDELEKFKGEDVDTNSITNSNPLSHRKLEQVPELLWQAVAQASSLVNQLKSLAPVPQSVPD